MALDGILLAETIDRVSESVEQDQTAHMCRLILIHTLRKFSPWSRTRIRVKLQWVKDFASKSLFHQSFLLNLEL